MRNYTEIRFSYTTGNGKFPGKPDLPSEIFFLAHTTPRHARHLWVVSFLPSLGGRPAATSALSTRFPGHQGPLSRRQILRMLEMGMGRLRFPEGAGLHDWIQRILLQVSSGNHHPSIKLSTGHPLCVCVLQ